MRQLQKTKRSANLKLILLFLVIFFCFASPLHAMDITLQWTPNSEPDVAGYKVFYREESESYNYSDPYWETIEPKCTVYDLDITKTYYFVVRAYNDTGESGNSNEVSWVYNAPDTVAPSVNVSGPSTTSSSWPPESPPRRPWDSSCSFGRAGRRGTSGCGSCCWSSRSVA